jgi:pimeloyl-ACP methyl ester carboxylesterase
MNAQSTDSGGQSMSIAKISRRWALALGLGLLGAATAGSAPSLAQGRHDRIPIVFVHGNGDTAALWQVVMWRFESNFWPRGRLFAIDLKNPTALTDNAIPEPGKSSTEDVKNQLADFVAKVRRFTRAPKVALVGNSRGANTIRNYVKNGGGAAVVSHVVLGGGVNHGVWHNPALLPNNEFNGASPFMQQLNAGPNEVVAGVKFFTIRSDFFDKFAQPDGRFIGLPGVPTGVSYDAPELDGARVNAVLAGADHREASYAPKAFALAYEFIAGREPFTLRIRPERRPLIAGKVTGLTAGLYNNIGVAGAKLAIYKVDRATGARRGGPVYAKVTGRFGVWGPFRADAGTAYEFEVRVPGQPVTHIYRSPFPRGSFVMHLRPAEAVSNPGDGSVVVLTRPRGYFGVDDTLLFNGARPAVSTDPVPNESATTIRTPFAPASHKARFENELIAVRNWPEGHVTIAEFSY